MASHKSAAQIKVEMAVKRAKKVQKMAVGGTPFSGGSLFDDEEREREFRAAPLSGVFDEYGHIPAFSVYNKPTYGSEIPGAPVVNQQRREFTEEGMQEAENRARTFKDNLNAVEPTGALGIVDALKTVGKSVAALPAYGALSAFDWLQTGKTDEAKSKARGEAIDKWMMPQTPEGGEILETIGKIGSDITGSEMGFGMHPNLWVSGIGLTTPKQTAAGLRLGKERITPFAKDVGTMATELYESGRMPGMVAPNLYAVSPEGKPTKALAPANEMGFYSPVEATALNLQRKSGSGQAFLNDIMKGENVRPDEIKTMGLDTFLKDKKNVTADEVRDYIAQNKIQLGETVYGGRIKEDPVGIAKRREIFDKYETEIQSLQNEAQKLKYDNPRYQEIENRLDEIQIQRDAEADAAYKIPENKNAKFGSYQLPGGENYREIVLTLPEKSSAYTLPQGASVEQTPSGKFRVTYKDGSSELYANENKLSQAFGGENLTYQSSHWDEPNPLAHLRVSDRVTDGKKTLLVDEVQSDWHQQGREEGYKTKESDVAQKAYKDYAGDLEKRYVAAVREKANSIYLPSDPVDLERFVRNTVNQTGLKDMARALGEEDKYNSLYYDYNLEKGQNRKGVPDAPYKDDWYQLTLRRAIKEAVDNGYDRVALPTGQRVAERFDLSQQIDRLDYNKNEDGSYNLSAIKDGKEVIAKEGISDKELSDMVGKDIAQKIIKDEGKSPEGDVDRWEPEDDNDVPQFKSLSGLDLSVGGKGMKKYYDEVYPNYLKKFAKKYGASVGDTKLYTMPKMNKPMGWGGAQYMRGEITLEEYMKANPDIANKYSETLHYMDITPKMREEFKTGIHMKKGGAVDKPSKMRHNSHNLTAKQPSLDMMRLALQKRG